MWDIVRGVCLGRYGEAEVAAVVSGGYSSPGAGAGGVGGPEGSGAGSMREEVGATMGLGEAGAGTNGGGSVPSAMGTVGERSPREALEAVREKIEGQAVIPKWASVETKGGLLVVHLNERCFEVEVYADELGYAHEKGFTEESKCKWVLPVVGGGMPIFMCNSESREMGVEELVHWVHQRTTTAQKGDAKCTSKPIIAYRLSGKGVRRRTSLANQRERGCAFVAHAEPPPPEI